VAAPGAAPAPVADGEATPNYELLRDRLEPHAKPGAWRFLRNERGRGYWLNVR
jgi:hypothetical protein